MALLLKNAVFTVVMPATVAVYVPLLINRGVAPSWGRTSALAIILLAVGGAAYILCVWEFAAFGRGTPFPADAPKKLVIHGLYKYTRNPMYLSVLTAILGWAFLFRSMTLVVYALFVCIAFQVFIVLYEERHLRRKFGDEYEAYCSRVHRWRPSRPGRRAV
jgi:protein-S-isoprenylcysteine O-methyltransferase Ste14